MGWIFFFSSIHWILNFAGQNLDVEVVFDENEMKTGLSKKDSLKENSGMLFVYDEEKILSFWMKNMKIPISIGFFDENQKLINFFDMALPIDGKPLPIYTSKSFARYALELPLGWFQKHAIKKGERFAIVN